MDKHGTCKSTWENKTSVVFLKAPSAGHFPPLFLVSRRQQGGVPLLKSCRIAAARIKVRSLRTYLVVILNSIWRAAFIVGDTVGIRNGTRSVLYKAPKRFILGFSATGPTFWIARSRIATPITHYQWSRSLVDRRSSTSTQDCAVGLSPALGETAWCCWC